MTQKKHWTLDDLPWDDFDASKVDPELLKICKAASLVEHNAHDYATYLINVFPGDQEVEQAAWIWAAEEVQHGQALARWCKLADPSFDFDRSFAKFSEAIKLPLEADASVRGSRVGEFVARCIVECGTSSMYTAFNASAQEPVLKAICKNIAADELRHYKLFYTHLQRYMRTENINRFRRLRVALGRAFETEDDELAFAYYAANHLDDGPYEHKRYNRAYVRRAYGCYKYAHLNYAIAMAFKAIGLKPHTWLNTVVSRISFGFISRRARKFAAQGA
ncbi:MAG: acyl-ACP desaturase [Alphaproteobacteria bacterium]